MAEESTFNMFPRWISLLFSTLGILPESRNVTLDRLGVTNRYLLAYGIVLIAAYDICFVYIHYKEFNNIIQFYSTIRQSIKITHILSKTLCFLVVQVIVFATNVQFIRNVYHNIIQKLVSLDMLFSSHPMSISTPYFSHIHRIMLAVLLLEAFFSHAPLYIFSQLLARVYVTSALEMFLVHVYHVKERFNLLNKTFDEFENNKELPLRDFNYRFSGYERSNIDLSVISQSCCLMGDAVQLIVSHHSWQLMACLCYALQQFVFMPLMLELIFSRRISSLTPFIYLAVFLYMLSLSLLIVQICIAFYICSAAKNEENKILKRVISLLNKDNLTPDFEMKLKRLLVQLPHYRHEFTILNLFDLKPSNLLTLLSLICAYCLTVIQFRPSNRQDKT